MGSRCIFLLFQYFTALQRWFIYWRICPLLIYIWLSTAFYLVDSILVDVNNGRLSIDYLYLGIERVERYSSRDAYLYYFDILWLYKEGLHIEGDVYYCYIWLTTVFYLVDGSWLQFTVINNNLKSNYSNPRVEYARYSLFVYKYEFTPRQSLEKKKNVSVTHIHLLSDN